ncbi:hypothetical protein D3C73_1322520 [compost metagenome]
MFAVPPSACACVAVKKLSTLPSPTWAFVVLWGLFLSAWCASTASSAKRAASTATRFGVMYLLFTTPAKASALVAMP